MQGHQVDWERVQAIPVLHFRSQREIIELGELIHKLPDPIIGCMEDVRAVLVNVDSITTLAVTVSADVLTLVYQENLLALATSFMGEDATEETSTNNEIVVHGLY
jgi:hypothetical protein